MTVDITASRSGRALSTDWLDTAAQQHVEGVVTIIAHELGGVTPEQLKHYLVLADTEKLKDIVKGHTTWPKCRQRLPNNEKCVPEPRDRLRQAAEELRSIFRHDMDDDNSCYTLPDFSMWQAATTSKPMRDASRCMLAFLGAVSQMGTWKVKWRCLVVLCRLYICGRFSGAVSWGGAAICGTQLPVDRSTAALPMQWERPAGIALPVSVPSVQHASRHAAGNVQAAKHVYAERELGRMLNGLGTENLPQVFRDYPSRARETVASLSQITEIGMPPAAGAKRRRQRAGANPSVMLPESYRSEYSAGSEYSPTSVGSTSTDVVELPGLQGTKEQVLEQFSVDAKAEMASFESSVAHNIRFAAKDDPEWPAKVRAELGIAQLKESMTQSVAHVEEMRSTLHSVVEKMANLEQMQETISTMAQSVASLSAAMQHRTAGPPASSTAPALGSPARGQR